MSLPGDLALRHVSCSGARETEYFVLSPHYPQHAVKSGHLGTGEHKKIAVKLPGFPAHGGIGTSEGEGHCVRSQVECFGFQGSDLTLPYSSHPLYHTAATHLPLTLPYSSHPLYHTAATHLPLIIPYSSHPALSNYTIQQPPTSL